MYIDSFWYICIYWIWMCGRYIFYVHVSSCLSLCLCEMSMQKTMLLIICTLECSHLYHLWAARCFPLRYDGDIQRSSYSKKAGASSWLREDREWSSLILSLCIPCVPCIPCIPRACLSHTTRLSAYRSAWHVLPWQSPQHTSRLGQRCVMPWHMIVL